MGEILHIIQSFVKMRLKLRLTNTFSYLHIVCTCNCTPYLGLSHSTQCCYHVVIFQIEGAGIKFPENKAAGVSLRSSRVSYVFSNNVFRRFWTDVHLKLYFSLHSF